MKKMIAAVCLIAIAGAFAGCTQNASAEVGKELTGVQGPAGENSQEAQEQEEKESAAAEETVSIIGSTTLQPLAQSIADELRAIAPEIKVEIQGVGSSAGIKAVIDKTADIGAASRELKAAEKEAGLTEHIVAYDGIAVVVNPANPVTALTTEEVGKIFSGEITNWKDVGGEDAEIIVISREAGSGTRDAFEELTALQKDMDGKKVSALKEDALIAEGNGAIKANIASKENSIAYLSLGYVEDSIKTVAIDGVTPSAETVKSGAYAISRPLLFLTQGELTAGTKKYLDYCFSEEGQRIVAEKYIPVN